MIPQYTGPKGLKLEQSEVNVDLKDFTGSPPLTGTLAFEGASKENVQELLNEQDDMMEDEFSGFQKKWNLMLVVKKWKEKMLNLIQSRNLNKLNEFHFKLLREQAPENPKNGPVLRSGKRRNCSSFLAFFFQELHFPVIKADHQVKVFWDLLTLIFSLTLFYFIIFELCLFANSDIKHVFDNFEFYNQFYLGMAIIFFMDILLKFNSCYFVNGLQTNDRKLIIQRYLSSEFIFDCISLVGLTLDYFGFLSENYFKFKFLFLFKYPNLKNLVHHMEELINFDYKIEALISIFKLFIKMLFLAHIIACIWLILPYITSHENNWMEAKGIMNKTTFEKYEYSLYWAFVTIATIGYGDITPVNQYEYLYTTGVVVLGSIFFGYSLSSVASIFQELDKEELAKKEKLQILNRYLKRNHIDFETQIQIKNYMNFLWEVEERQSSQKEQEIFDKLTSSLKDKILLQTYGKILFPVPAFSNNFTKEFLTKILSIMKPVFFDPNATIYRQGETNDIGLYIIHKGEIELSFSKNEKKGKNSAIKTLKEGEILGDYEFFTKKERVFTSRSLTYSTAYVIYLKDFEILLQQSPEDNEKYQYIKDQITLYNNFKNLFSSSLCYSCHKNNHLTMDCPLISSLNNKLFICAKANYPFIQSRAPFLRRKQKSTFFYVPQYKEIQDLFDDYKSFEKQISGKTESDGSDTNSVVDKSSPERRKKENTNTFMKADTFMPEKNSPEKRRKETQVIKLQTVNEETSIQENMEKNKSTSLINNFNNNNDSPALEQDTPSLGHKSQSPRRYDVMQTTKFKKWKESNQKTIEIIKTKSHVSPRKQSDKDKEKEKLHQYTNKTFEKENDSKQKFEEISIMGEPEKKGTTPLEHTEIENDEEKYKEFLPKSECLSDFEKMQIYKIYFPKGNITFLINKINEKVMENELKMKEILQNPRRKSKRAKAAKAAKAKIKEIQIKNNAYRVSNLLKPRKISKMPSLYMENSLQPLNKNNF